jgi:GAF domain-containing protein
VLRSSTGEAGQQLLARGHRLQVGSLSVIGQVTTGRRPVLARDTDTDAVHRRNELLPLTRSEMALPLIAGDQVIGALDLQSVEPDAFREDVIPTLQALADQLAVAIENARLYTQTQQSLRELEELYGEVTERSWADFLAEAREPERRQVYGPEPNALQVERSMVVKRVLGAGSLIMATGQDGRQAFLAAPIVVRNEVIGVLGVEPDGAREWTQDDLTLIQSIAERTAMAVENARLYLQAQRAAERERLVNTIAARLQRAPNLPLLLESAAQELAQALGTDNVYAEISLDQPLAQARREVSGQESGPVEGEARPAEPPGAEAAEATAPSPESLEPDAPEGARAE